MLSKYLLFILIFPFIVAAPVAKVYNIIDFGAKSDGVFNNATSIQKAIDKAAENGGGQVLIPDGYYISGPITLKSNVELHLSDHATLLGSTDFLEYSKATGLSLINANGQQNISITGKGTVDGRGRDLVVNLLKLLTDGKVTDPQWRLKRPNTRPSVLNIINCSKIKITGVRIKNSAAWVQHYSNCSDIVIDGVEVESVAYWNNDGIDINDCKNVKITNSSINSADDAICLKSESNNPTGCENIYVENCVLRSSASGFKIGTGTTGNFKKITVKNITVYNTYRSAIALEAVDGGTIEDIDIRDVVVKNSGNAIFIRLGHRNVDSKYSAIRHVYIANVKAEVTSGKPDIGYPVEGPLPRVPPHNLVPASCTGLPGHPVQDVTLENIEISYGGGASKLLAYMPIDSLASITENVKGYPEFTMFGELPAWGFYVRHAEGIIFKNMTLSYLTDDFRPAYVFDDVKGLQLNKITVTSGKQVPVMVMNKVSGSSLQEIKLPFKNTEAIKVQ